MKSQLVLRRLVLFGAPLFVGFVLLLHPSATIPESGKALDVFGFIAPVADRFVLVHLLFAPALALLGLAMQFLLTGLHGRAATVSRLATPIAILCFIVYESIVGSATGNLVRTALNLPAAQQAIIAEAASKLWADPILGDFPALIPLIAFITWTLALITAVLALRRAGTPILICAALILSSGLTFHALPSGPLAMLFFLLTAWWVERAGEKILRSDGIPPLVQTAV
jgi:hypothetical protein